MFPQRHIKSIPLDIQILKVFPQTDKCEKPFFYRHTDMKCFTIGRQISKPFPQTDKNQMLSHRQASQYQKHSHRWTLIKTFPQTKILTAFPQIDKY